CATTTAPTYLAAEYFEFW
nr:immunoglobulin heavy chain junction region [Macaca mulatta]MOX00751.1 immunoglobulin heavy chain junction region [Macaca mulatta]MOX01617.1 immunoglobulin heavy chain junction region [Macaca mulatta]MOX02629.1 immunoglobulin heavy chain junction region [Macaca mulatta]